MVTAIPIHQFSNLFGKLLDFVDCCVFNFNSNNQREGCDWDYTLLYASNLLVNLLTNSLFFEWKIAMQTLFRCHFHQDSLNSSYFINCKSVSETQ